MTSNLGSQIILGERNPVVRDAKIQELLRGAFKPEFLNRIDEVIVFDHLEKKDLAHIVEHYVAGLNKQLKDRDLTLVLTDAAKAQLLEEGYDPDYGARPMKRVFQKRIQDKLALELLKGGFKPGEIKLDYDSKSEQLKVVS